MSTRKTSRAPMGWNTFYIPGEMYDDTAELARLREGHQISVEQPPSGKHVMPPRPLMPYEVFLERRRRAAGLHYDKRVARSRVTRN